MDEDLLFLLINDLVYNLSDPKQVEAVILLDQVIQRHSNGPDTTLGAEAGKLSSFHPELDCLVFG